MCTFYWLSGRMYVPRLLHVLKNPAFAGMTCVGRVNIARGGEIDQLVAESDHFVGIPTVFDGAASNKQP